MGRALIGFVLQEAGVLKEAFLWGGEREGGRWGLCGSK